jgi:hypothetical protein
LRAASISSGVTLEGDGAAARAGSANSAVAASPVEAVSTSRRDQFRSGMVSSLFSALDDTPSMLAVRRLYGLQPMMA